MSVFIISLSSCVVLISLLRGIAHRFGIVDKPGGRKLHEAATPTVGGLAMFIAVLMALTTDHSLHGRVAILLGCAAALVALGVLDDRYGLSVSLRMLIEVFLVTVVIIGAGGDVTHLGTMFGNDIPLGMFAVPFSIVAFVGGINAINMIDGADGMAGKMALSTMLGVVSIFYLANAPELPIALAMMGTLLGFLLFNSRLFVKRAYVFMGDAGSMWLGLVLGWFMAKLTHHAVGAEPALVLWLFGIPLIDTLAVMIRRLKQKRSPFDPDRTHIHHVFQDHGISVQFSVLALTFVQLALVGTGVIFYWIHASDLVVFWSFILLLSAYVYGMRNYKHSLGEMSFQDSESEVDSAPPAIGGSLENS
jgi:UDP-GlcNAc:undecaprenyl-phosphate GlcNAc-1-phosphate transferase